MNKLIITTMVSLVSISPLAHAKILSPSLITPQNNEIVGLKQPLKFSWQAKNPTTIKQYHLIISNNERFSNYDLGKGQCVKATPCADFITQATSYPMAKTHAFLQKENSYFWQVVAIGKTGDRSLIFQGSENASTGSQVVRKQVNINQFSVVQKFADIDSIDVAPREAANGSTFNFSVLLTDELPDGQSVKIDVGDGWKIMTGTGLDYRYQHAFTVPTSIHDTPISFKIAVFDENDEEQKRLDDSITILANVEPEPELNNVAPTLSFVSGADSIVKNKTYTLKLNAKDDDGNLDRVEVTWGDGSANDSKTATNGATLTFSHTYKFAGIQNLIATAFDDAEASSDDFSKSITVTDSIVPSVSTINATPNSITQGNAATFSTTLSASLPIGYSVKINYGNGLVKMNGSGTRFNLSAAPTSLGSGLYTVGIYDSKNVLKSNQLTGNFEVVEPARLNVSPTLSFVSGDTKATTGVAVSVKLSASDRDGNLSRTVIDWGDTFTDSQTGATPSFSHIYATVGSFSWSAIAYDSANATSPPVSKIVTVSTVSQPTTGYSKIANNGSTLADFAKLGASSTDWACTKDNKTGLMWEVKTTDGGLRDMNNYYTWDNSFNFAADVNAQRLCGKNDWRLPTNEELKGLVVCSDSKYNKLAEGELGFICASNTLAAAKTTKPAINTNYFPNTSSSQLSGWFWSSSLYTYYNGYAWFVSFYDGGTAWNFTTGSGSVRLVREDKPPVMAAYSKIANNGFSQVIIAHSFPFSPFFK